MIPKIICYALIPLTGTIGWIWLYSLPATSPYFLEKSLVPIVTAGCLLAASLILINPLSRITGSQRSAAIFLGVAAGSVGVWLLVSKKGCFHDFPLTFTMLMGQLLPVHGALIMAALFWAPRTSKFSLSVIWRLGVAAIIGTALSATWLSQQSPNLLLFVMMLYMAWGLSLAIFPFLVESSPQQSIITGKCRLVWIFILGALFGVGAVAFTQDTNLVRSGLLGATLAIGYEVLQRQKYDFGKLRIPIFTAVGAIIGGSIGYLVRTIIIERGSACDYDFMVGDSFCTVLWMSTAIGAGLYGFIQLRQVYRLTFIAAIIPFLFFIGTASVLSYVDMIDVNNAATVIPFAMARPLPFGVLLFSLCALCGHSYRNVEPMIFFNFKSIPTVIGALLLIGISITGAYKNYDFYYGFADWKAAAEYKHPEILANLSGTIISYNNFIELPSTKKYKFSSYENTTTLYPVSARYAFQRSSTDIKLLSLPDMNYIKDYPLMNSLNYHANGAISPDEKEVVLLKTQKYKAPVLDPKTAETRARNERKKERKRQKQLGFFFCEPASADKNEYYLNIYSLPGGKLLRQIKLEEKPNYTCWIDHQLICSSRSNLFSLDDQTGKEKFLVAGENPKPSPYNAHAFTYISQNKIMEYNLNTAETRTITEFKPSRYVQCGQEYAFSPDRKFLCLEVSSKSLGLYSTLLIIPLQTPSQSHLLVYDNFSTHVLHWIPTPADNIKKFIK